MVGIRPLGLRARYSGVSTTPKAMPASMRSKGRSSSAQHHSTFWTLIEFVRPQILSMFHLPRYNLLGAPRLGKAAKCASRQRVRLRRRRHVADGHVLGHAPAERAHLGHLET